MKYIWFNCCDLLLDVKRGLTALKNSIFHWSYYNYESKEQKVITLPPDVYQLPTVEGTIQKKLSIIAHYNENKCWNNVGNSTLKNKVVNAHVSNILRRIRKCTQYHIPSFVDLLLVNLWDALHGEICQLAE